MNLQKNKSIEPQQNFTGFYKKSAVMLAKNKKSSSEIQNVRSLTYPIRALPSPLYSVS